MKYRIISIFLLVMQICLVSAQIDSDRVAKIAYQMALIGSECRYLSSNEMKKKRLAFLSDNKDATVGELVCAIETEVNSQDIITLLQSFDCDVCNEYAASLASDHARGVWAIGKGKQDLTVNRLLWLRLL